MAKKFLCFCLMVFLFFGLFPHRAHATYTTTATIASGASLSGIVDLTSYIHLGNQTSVAIIMPSSWTPANMTFFVSADGVNFSELYDGAGNEYTVVASSSRYILLDPSVFGSILFFKIQSGTTGSPVNQGAARTLSIAVN